MKRIIVASLLLAALLAPLACATSQNEERQTRYERGYDRGTAQRFEQERATASNPGLQQ